MSDERFAWAIKSPTGGYNAIYLYSKESALREWLDSPSDDSDATVQRRWDNNYGLFGWNLVKIRLVEAA